jgi:hypothetical protein
MSSSTLSLMNRIAPSPINTLTPPTCQLLAARQPKGVNIESGVPNIFGLMQSGSFEFGV